MTRFGYIRTSRHLQEGVAGMDPFSQELRLRESGVRRDHVYRDSGVSGATGTDLRHGWRRLDGRLSGGDTLVVVRHRPDRTAVAGHPPVHHRPAGPGGEDPVPR